MALIKGMEQSMPEGSPSLRDAVRGQSPPGSWRGRTRPPGRAAARSLSSVHVQALVQRLAVELIVDRDRRSHNEVLSSNLMHYDIILGISEASAR
jgi:hypothetical protein